MRPSRLRRSAPARRPVPLRRPLAAAGYVHFATDPDVLPPLLFVLEADPDQVDDLVHDPGHQGVVADRCGELLRWRMRHDERTLTGHLLTPEGLVVHRDPHR